MSDLVPTFLIETLLNEDENKVSLRATGRLVDQSMCKPITSEIVLHLLEQRGFGRFRIDLEQVIAITDALSESIAEIDDQAEIKDFLVETDVIAEAFDAIGKVDISEDKLQAILSITPAEGGKHLSMGEAELLLEEQGVTYGVDQNKIETLLLEAKHSTEEEPCNAVVAVALIPVRGDDAQFIPLVDTANERILKPQLREDGTVDMLDLGDLPTVKVGVALMKKVPPTEGEKGINVCWGLMAPDAGNDFEFKPGPGTRVSDEDELILLSSISGQPNLLDRGMKVDDAVTVKAVDLATGHLSLDANLLVKGDICEGMKVRCAGDITVGGVVESADVKAKGNIIIGKGILGRTAEHSAKDTPLTVSIQADGFISAMFASYAQLNATGDILISEQLLHCNTSSKAKIVVGNKKTVGSQIVGGITRASESIETDILGASAGVITRFDLSGPFEFKNFEVSCNRSIIDGVSKMLDNMRDAYSKFLSIPMTDARKVHIDKIKNTITFLENEIIGLEERGQLLTDESEQLCHGLMVRANRKIQPNVIVTIGLGKFKSSRERESGEIFYEAGEIIYNPINPADKK